MVLLQSIHNDFFLNNLSNDILNTKPLFTIAHITHLSSGSKEITSAHAI